MNELILKTQEDIINLANETIKRNNIIPSKTYNVNNAMVALYNNVLNVKTPNGKLAIEECTPMSIQNAVFQCIINELTPAKSQAYFIPYGKELKFTMSYFGMIKLMKDKYGLEVNADVVREGDAFDIINRPDGTKTIKHKANPQSIWDDKPIVGAYAVLSTEDGKVANSNVMSWKNIQISALKHQGDAKVFKEFTEEMCKKIVVRRLCKPYLNASDDSTFVKITNPDGTTTVISNYNDTLIDDFEDTDYTIDVNENFEPTEDNIAVVNKDTLTSDDLKIDKPVKRREIEVPEGAIEIAYAEYKNNKEAYQLVRDSYDPATKTCWVLTL